MKRILGVIDNQKMAEATVGFACFLRHFSQSKLTGIFLERPSDQESTHTKDLKMDGLYI